MHIPIFTLVWATGVAAMLFWISFTVITAFLRSRKTSEKKKVAVYAGAFTVIAWLVMVSTAFWTS